MQIRSSETTPKQGLAIFKIYCNLFFIYATTKKFCVKCLRIKVAGIIFQTIMLFNHIYTYSKAYHVIFNARRILNWSNKL